MNRCCPLTSLASRAGDGAPAWPGISSDPPEVQQLLDAGTYGWRTWTTYFIETGLLVLLILQIRVRRRMVK